jgi:hypothetical protein
MLQDFPDHRPLIHHFDPPLWSNYRRHRRQLLWQKCLFR